MRTIGRNLFSRVLPLVAAALVLSLLQVPPSDAKSAKVPGVQQTKPIDVRPVGFKSPKLPARATTARLQDAAIPRRQPGETRTAGDTWSEPLQGLTLRRGKGAPADIAYSVEPLGADPDHIDEGVRFQIRPAPDAVEKKADPSPTVAPTSVPDISDDSVPATPTEAAPKPATPIKPASIQVQLDYSAYADALGGDWSSRLALFIANDCQGTDFDCESRTPIPTVNNSKSKTLTATVPASAMSSNAPMTLAAAATTGGNKGDFAASPLSPAGSWSGGNQAGDFTWSYPIGTPPGINGPTPDLSINYSSGSVDGRTSSSNNQTSWIGEGFDLDPGFVERSYVPCRDVDGNSDGSEETDDLCWRGDNLTMSFAGHSGKLIRDGSSTQWRLKGDDGTKIELKKSDGINRDDNGEYWVATTNDGTQYYFGRDTRFDSEATKADSVSTVPVYGSEAGQPCHDSSFASSDCRQAWRWSLDYVVDSHGNSMSLYYDQATNTYGTDKGDHDADYDRASVLTRIDYGTRSGSEHGKSPARVVFGTDERCDGSSDYCDSISDHPSRWPDVPTDQICSSSCDDQRAPTFFSRKRLTSITTQVLDPGTGDYSSVNEWDLKQSFPSSGDGTDPALWLNSIQSTGKVGTDVTLPAVEFFGTQMDNRVDAIGDNADPFIKRRVTAIKNGTGGTISVLYSAPDCTSSDKPSSSKLDTNSRRCFPSYYQPPGYADPRLDFFHKYRVEQVTESDSTGGAPAVYTRYSYKGGDSWHYTDDDAQRPKYRTWNQWRGYSEVSTTVGNSTTRSFTSTLYLRGMDGDKKDGGGTKSVTVSDGDLSASIVDKDQYQGFERREVTKLGESGSILGVTVNTPWSSAATAQNSDNETAHIVNTGATEVRTRLSTGADRTTRTSTTFNDDGLPTQAQDSGDISLTSDDRCTSTDYAQNRSDWILNLPSKVTTTVGPCSATPSSSDDVISSTRTTYDGGATPSKGDALKVESASGWDSGITYQTDATSTYDNYGRPTSTIDSGNAQTLTAYAPATGIPTSVTTTNPLGQTSSTTLNRAWGSPNQKTDISGGKTDYEYDALGRVTSTWVPGREKGSGQSATYKYAYKLRSNGASSVTTEKLNAAADYVPSVQLFDGLMRERSTQTPAAGPNGGWLISEKIYDTRGLVESDRGPFYTTTDPGGNLVVGGENEYPTYTNYTYDAAGRTTRADFASRGAVKWSTVTSYGGDRVNVTPPAGGTATTTITDARGQTTSLLQYTGPAPTGTADATNYTYTPGGQIKSITNAAGNTWKRDYDIRGRLVKDTDPDKGVTTYTYDSRDRQVSSTDARGITLWNKYDALGRKVELHDDNADGTKRASWTYDTVKPGLLSSSTRFVGNDEYTSSVTAYDAAGRVTSSKLMLPQSEGLLYKAAGYTTTSTYNPDGSLKTQVGPAVAGIQNETLAWSYDKLGNVDTFGGVGSFINDTIYSPYGQVLRRDMGPTAGKSVYDTRDYDEPTGRLISHKVTTQASSSSALDLRYTFDAVGNVKKLNDVATGDTAQTSASTMRQCFNYDYLRRMTSAYTSSGNTCATPTTSNLGSQNPYWDTYTFDKSGNRTKLVAVSKAGSTTNTTTSTSTFPAPTDPRPHALSKVVKTGSATGTETFSYDATGNTATRSKSTTAGQTIEWDREGHEKTITDKASGKTTEYLYDADGARLIKRDTAAGSTTLYVGTAEVTLKGTTLSSFRSYSVNGEPVIVRDSDGVKITIADHQGTPVLTIDGTTLAATKRRLGPFGQPLAVAAWPTSRGFLNKPTDATGTTHLEAREYDPTLGRFLSVDPVMDPMDPQQLNGYAYSNNSPITMSDPDGQFPGVPNWLKNAGKKVRNFGVGVGGGFTGFADFLWTGVPSSISFRPSGHPGSFMGGFPDMRLRYDRKPVVTPWLYKHTGTDANSKFTKAGEWASILIPVGGEASASGKIPRFLEMLGLRSSKKVAERLPQDLAVSSKAPAALPTEGRSIGRASHDRAVQADIDALPRGATDIRLNQQQVNAAGERVGVNRPDLQYTLNGKRYYKEYEGPGNPRGDMHEQRILANDPGANFKLEKIP